MAMGAYQISLPLSRLPLVWNALTREANRLHNVLQDARIKLATVAPTSWASRAARC
jgi:hypothetical protein